MQHTFKPHHKQLGAALITALSILLVLTILGIATVSTTVLQERMAGNARDYEVAFEAAESTLRQAETYINGLTDTTAFDSTGTAGLFSTAYVGNAWETNSNWTNARTGSVGPDVGEDPKYIIQQIDATVTDAPQEEVEATGYQPGNVAASNNVKVFQVTVRGYGLSAKSRVMLQSYYAKNFN